MENELFAGLSGGMLTWITLGVCVLLFFVILIVLRIIEKACLWAWRFFTDAGLLDDDPDHHRRSYDEPFHTKHTGNTSLSTNQPTEV